MIAGMASSPGEAFGMDPPLAVTPDEEIVAGFSKQVEVCREWMRRSTAPSPSDVEGQEAFERRAPFM